MNVKNYREINETVIQLIHKLKITTQLDLYNFLGISKLKPNQIAGNKRNFLFNLSNHQIFGERMYSLDRKNFYTMDYLKKDDAYVSTQLFKKDIIDIDGYKSFIEFFSILATSLDIPNVDDITIVNERIIDFYCITPNDSSLKKVRIVNYDRTLSNERILDFENINAIMVLLDEKTINLYKDLNIPLDISSSVYYKSKDDLIRDKNVINLREKINEL